MVGFCMFVDCYCGYWCVQVGNVLGNICYSSGLVCILLLLSRYVFSLVCIVVVFIVILIIVSFWWWLFYYGCYSLCIVWYLFGLFILFIVGIGVVQYVICWCVYFMLVQGIGVGGNIGVVFFSLVVMCFCVVYQKLVVWVCMVGLMLESLFIQFIWLVSQKKFLLWMMLFSLCFSICVKCCGWNGCCVWYMKLVMLYFLVFGVCLLCSVCIQFGVSCVCMKLKCCVFSSLCNGMFFCDVSSNCVLWFIVCSIVSVDCSVLLLVRLYLFIMIILVNFICLVSSVIILCVLFFLICWLWLVRWLVELKLCRNCCLFIIVISVFSWVMLLRQNLFVLCIWKVVVIGIGLVMLVDLISRQLQYFVVVSCFIFCSRLLCNVQQMQLLLNFISVFLVWFSVVLLLCISCVLMLILFMLLMIIVMCCFLWLCRI